MPAVVRNVGDLKHAKNIDGEEVHRQPYIHYQGSMTPVLNTDNHFIYRSKRIGSSLLCTCGSQAVSVGYHTYRKYASYMGNEVLICYHLMSNGRHADGSS